MAVEISSASIIGYRQVEDNHLSAKRDGRVYAQLPAAASIDVLEQGTFAKYDYENGEVNFTGDGPWMMVYNEEKLYDERKQMHRDYAMVKADALNGVITPRLLGMVPGDLYTTNNLADDSYTLGDEVAPNAQGILDKASASAAKTAGTLVLKVVKEYTLPDMQPAVKLQVIQA